MNVSLTPEIERFISGLVATGRYRSASEVVRAAVRLLEEREEEREVTLESLRENIAVGVAQLDRGQGVPADEVFEKILEALRSSEAA